jgi:hypothetical protein
VNEPTAVMIAVGSLKVALSGPETGMICHGVLPCASYRLQAKGRVDGRRQANVN